MNELIFDTDFFAEITDNDAKMQQEILRMFIAQVDGDIAQMQHHFEEYILGNMDLKSWLNSAHKIYGSAANIGANQLAHNCDIAQSLNEGDVAQITHYQNIIIEDYKALCVVIFDLLVD